MTRQTLRYKVPNMKCSDVKYFQQKLNKQGFNLSEDGIYGKNSFNACKSFQKMKGLVTDGICGTKTWNAIESVQESTTPSEAEHIILLRKWGFGNMIQFQGEKAAIKQFQAAMSLRVDGIVGNQTLGALRGNVITPRIQEEDTICSCQGKYCNGYPKGKGANQGVLILAERIFRKVEEKYPGTSFYVTSWAHNPGSGVAGGYRCDKWNQIRGGASGSQHKAGTALDIYGQKTGVAQSTIRKYIETIALSMNTKGGVGYGATYIVHIDTRGSRARWKY